MRVVSVLTSALVRALACPEVLTARFWRALSARRAPDARTHSSMLVARRLAHTFTRHPLRRSLLASSSSHVTAVHSFRCLRLLHSSPPRRMNVTRANFDTALEELRRLLPTASFVAIDEEMTGIHLPGAEKMEKMDDTTDQRYQKMRLVAQHYKIIQIGLCLFHELPPLEGGEVEEVPRFEARPYNFYLFPESGAINMEAAAIAFNKTHGMDFNKWIYEGIPYVTQERHEELIHKFYGQGEEGWRAEQLRAGEITAEQAAAAAAAAALPQSDQAVQPPQPQQKEKPKRTITLDKESDIAWLKEVQSKIFEWLKTRKTEEHELVLPEANSFLRLAAHQWMESASAESIAEQGGGAVKSNLSLESRSLPNQRWKVSFVLTHYTPEERVELDRAALVKKRGDLDAKLGFKRVWDALREARAPIIVHNGFFDVLFMWSHFQSAELPESLIDFKVALGSAFPAGVFDTKFLSNSRQFAYPLEFINKQRIKQQQQQQEGEDGGQQLTEQQRARIRALEGLNLPESTLTSIRFRETHLEKLYLRLKVEREMRNSIRSNANGKAEDASAPVAVAEGAAPAAAPAAAVSSSPPPPPFSDVVITLAPGFDKYARVGEPGGDDSAAHEAGYDAFMTAVIFASFAAEAPREEFLTPLRNNRAAGVSTAAQSAKAMQSSPWLGRIPLFRHLMALDLNVDASTGLPRADSLVDPAASVWIMRGFPDAWKTEDILALFEKEYTSAKRKMGEATVAVTPAAAADTAAAEDKMSDVGRPLQW